MHEGRFDLQQWGSEKNVAGYWCDAAKILNVKLIVGLKTNQSYSVLYK